MQASGKDIGFCVIVHTLCLLQPIAVTDTEVERPLYTPSDYTSKFIILLIWSAVAFFVCWPISLVVCCLTCAVSPLCLFGGEYMCTCDCVGIMCVCVCVRACVCV